MPPVSARVHEDVVTCQALIRGFQKKGLAGFKSAVYSITVLVVPQAGNLCWL